MKIKSAKEAKKAVEKFAEDSKYFGGGFCRAVSFEAEGYLAALRGPEVTALVEALKRLKLQHFGRVQATAHILPVSEQEGIAVRDAEFSIAQFQESLKP